jgi:hypothetical protein
MAHHKKAENISEVPFTIRAGGFVPSTFYCPAVFSVKQNGN